MAKLDLDISRIRKSKKPKELVVYLGEVRKEGHSDLDICKALSEAKDVDLHKYSLIAIFLSWSNAPDVIAFLVRHGTARLGRRRAILAAGKSLSNANSWETMWRALGETKGLVELFATVSVNEVKLLALAIGLPGRRKTIIEARQKAIEGLVKALLPHYYPGSPYASQEKRPIQHHYARMVPACTHKFINNILDAKDGSNPLYAHFSPSRFLKIREDLVRERVDAALFGPEVGQRDNNLPVQTFLYRDKDFAVKVVQLRLKDPHKEPWPPSVTELNVVVFHLRRMWEKHRSPDSELRSMVLLALQVVRTKGRQEAQRCAELWSIICALWWRMPKPYEEIFVAALRLNLPNSKPSRMGQGYFIAKDGKSSVDTWNWTLLRLYCLHVPRDGIDLEAATDYKPLAETLWPAKLFLAITKDQANRLLKGLYDANPNFNFLESGPQSILTVGEVGCLMHKNFNVDLLLAMLNQESEETVRDAYDAVEKLRRRASTSKEQADRAEIGRAASARAIASGDLELYAETVIWQQRFIRDPLTLKTLFSGISVLSKEGVGLLCGIPEILPRDFSLADVSSRIEKSNGVLNSFEEARLLAKRQPSFSQSDWRGVTSLPASVFRERVSRAQKLQMREFANQRLAVFNTIWESGLLLAGKIQNDFECIEPLFMNLPPSGLHDATQAMLDEGDKRRKKEDRQPEDTVLEGLSYKALAKLAGGDEPGLARGLIFRTVLERPDASAWHRQLLSLGFMKRLPAEDAGNLLVSFASAIGEKLEEQSYVKVGAAERQKSAPPQSIVKVTTVKYLAQLLDKAEFISADEAIKVLIELFRTGTHRDIRLATLGSLLSSLNDACKGTEGPWSNPMAKEIFNALKLIIPVAGSINEQSPPREQDWLEASKTRVLPDVADMASGGTALFNEVISAAKGGDYPDLKQLQSEFMEELIAPMIKQSMKEHQRWVFLFLAKHKAQIKDLPPTPVDPFVWELVLSLYPHLAPPNVLEDYYRYLAAALAPSDDLKSFNDQLASESSLRNLPEVQHWLKMYSHTKDDYQPSGLNQLLRAIDALNRRGQEAPRLSEMVISLASLVLDDYERYQIVWSSFARQFRPPLGFRQGAKEGDLPENYRTWQKTRRPLLVEIVEGLQGRKQGTTRSQMRSLLPSTVDIQILLLPFTTTIDAVEADKQRRRFGIEFNNLVLSAFQSGTSVLQWPKVADATVEIAALLPQREERLKIADYVGQLEEAEAGANEKGRQLISAVNLVKFRTATRLVEDGWLAAETTLSDKDASILRWKRERREKLKGMVQKWQACSDESLLEELTEWRRANRGIWNQLFES